MIVGFATQGSTSNDGERLAAVLSEVDGTQLPFDRAHKLKSAIRTARRVRALRPELVVLEGTGVAGGIAVLATRALGVPYVVSTGDAIAPYVALRSRVLGVAARGYERALYRRSSGVIGWTPYLVGRALTLGAPTGMSLPGWGAAAAPPEDRRATRAELGIEPDAIVVGIAGSLTWSARRDYCYGLELVKARQRTHRSDVVVLIVGDGDGRRWLEDLAGSQLGREIVITGRVPRADVPRMLGAMDVGSLPQSSDAVGSFRYSTKLPEYLAAGLPVVTGRIPAAYDLDRGWLWRLPGPAPWSETYVDALASWMETISRADVAEAAEQARTAGAAIFDRREQLDRVSAFLADVTSRPSSGRVRTPR